MKLYKIQIRSQKNSQSCVPLRTLKTFHAPLVLLSIYVGPVMTLAGKRVLKHGSNDTLRFSLDSTFKLV